MPKDEFDFEDPFELNGMAFATQEDTTNDMAECFVEEFRRMGYNHNQILALFRNPQYLGPNMALEKRGEPFVRDLISDILGRWGKAAVWPEIHSPGGGDGDCRSPSAPAGEQRTAFASIAAVEEDESISDPMGGPAPKLNV